MVEIHSSEMNPQKNIKSSPAPQGLYTNAINGGGESLYLFRFGSIYSG